MQVQVAQGQPPGLNEQKRPGPKVFWTAPRIWPGGCCYILGGGPSLARVPIERLRRQRVIAVNNAYRLGSWIDVMFYGDCRWLDWHKDALLDFPGLKVTCCESHLGKPGIKVLRRVNSPGLALARDRLCWNLSSGACAINLAVHFGVSKIILLGYDMRQVEGRNNWHKDHQIVPKVDAYARFLRPFPEIARSLERMGIECVNATPGSALDCFRVVLPEEVMP